MSGRPSSKIDSAVLSQTSKTGSNEPETKGKSTNQKHIRPTTQIPPRDSTWKTGSYNIGRGRPATSSSSNTLTEASTHTKHDTGIGDLRRARANLHAATHAVGRPAKNTFEDSTRATKTRKALLEKAKRTEQLEHELRKDHRASTSFHNETCEAHDREESARYREPHRPHHKIWCGNDIRDPRLIRNGGDLRIGKPSECFRRGVGGGIHQKVAPEKTHEFLNTRSALYEKYIEQQMYYGDGDVPEGKIRATLGQCLSRGFAVGSIQKTKKIIKRRKEAGWHS